MILTLDQVAAACGARVDRAQVFLPHLIEAMQAYDITTRKRGAMFLSNAGHETMGLKHTQEIWGPSAAQSRYEGRADLGNLQPGDGSKFRGHGLFHTTGRHNHRATTARLRAKFPHLTIPDFEEHPEQLAEVRWACLSAGDYVAMRDMNALADAGEFLSYCVRLNGRNRDTGLPNGWPDRQRLYGVAMNVLQELP